MKAKKLLLLLIITISFSCTQNDGINLNNAASADLLGTWNVTASRLENGVSETTFMGQTFSTTSESYGKDFDFTFVFSENPNTVVAQGMYTTVLTSTTAGITTTQEIPTSSIDGLDSGTWTLGTNSIILIDNQGEASEGFLEEFTPTKLVIRIVIDQTITLAQGMVNHTTGAVYYTLEK